MATVISNFKVKDYPTWKTAFDLDEARRKGAGMTVAAIGPKAGDAGNVYVVFNVEDMAKMQQMMSNPELQQIMKESGVLTPMETVVLD